MFKLLKYLKTYSVLLIIIFVLAVLQAASNLYLPNLMSDIVNNGIAKFDTPYIWRTGGVMVIVAIGGAISAVIGIYFSSQVAAGMATKLREALFHKVQNFSLHEFDTVSTASLITRTTNDTNQIQQVMVQILNMFITAPITLVVGIILALNQDVGLSWIIVAIVPVLLIVILFLLFKAIPLFGVMQVKLDKLNLILDENLTGVRVVRAFNRIKHEEERFDVANKDVTTIAISVNQLMSIMMPVMMFLINISSVAIIWFGSQRVAGGTLQIGAMFAFLQYTVQILLALLFLAMMFIMIPRAEASAKRINEIMAMEPEIKDPKKVKKTGKKRGFVEFKDVTFSYHGAEKPALSDISFSAHPGQVTAIIGGTGSGKSTLVNLIPRFYDVESGQILVDGIETREMSQADLRSKIGFVPQKAILFAGTIKDNLRYGKEDATDREIKHATEVSQASDFISKMKEGFNSLIAQGGTNVSGGQMQRLSIARALIRKPEIYVFDDTFSALDFKTDANLRTALKNETKEATVIIVAQRVSTVIDADQIIVIDDGRTVGIGKHHDLMKSCEVYRDIVSSQLSSAEIEQEG
ncbi:MAG: ABC transporter ATP-binding protein [Patescibacteria group bacterium]|jgi:ATP-binding cassette subfamily B protein